MPTKEDKFLVFDCSTIGMPKRWDAPHTDTFNWPRVIHLAYRLYDSEYQLLKECSDIIKPDGFQIPQETIEKHRIDQETADKEGRPIKDVLEDFSKVIDESNYTLSFNLNFNLNTIAAEFFRAGIDHRLFETEQYCIMEESTYFCGIRGKNGRYKWPSLRELCISVFGKDVPNLGKADIDVVVAAKSVFALMKADKIDIF